jgi:hypothetical protein
MVMAMQKCTHRFWCIHAMVFKLNAVCLLCNIILCNSLYITLFSIQPYSNPFFTFHSAFCVLISNRPKYVILYIYIFRETPFNFQSFFGTYVCNWIGKLMLSWLYVHIRNIYSILHMWYIGFCTLTFIINVRSLQGQCTW